MEIFNHPAISRQSKAKKSGVIATLAAVMTLSMVSFGGVAPATAATNPATVKLGAAANYSVLAGTSITNTGKTILSQSIGVSPGLSVTGLATGVVGGLAALDAQADLALAYSDAERRAATAKINAQLAGQRLTAGVYESNTGDFLLDGVLTLDGRNDPNSVFILQADSLRTGIGSQIKLINGAQACNVFIQVDGAATLGPNSAFAGTVLALNSITAKTSATVEGRLLSRTGAVTLDANLFTAPGCKKTYTPPAQPAPDNNATPLSPLAITGQAVDSAGTTGATTARRLFAQAVPVPAAPVAPAPAAPAEPEPAPAPETPTPDTPAPDSAADAPVSNADPGEATGGEDATAGLEAGVVSAQGQFPAQDYSSSMTGSQDELASTGVSNWTPVLTISGLILLLLGAVFVFLNRHRFHKG